MKRLGSFIACWLLACTALAGDFDHSYAALARVLQAHVRNERVDYAALNKDSRDLDLWLQSAASVPESDFKHWSEAQQLAFLINLYNAGTLRLIADHYPVKSIKNIGSIFKGPWKQEVISLFGARVTLDYIEHGLLRQNYQEPRIHFAIVCAAKGCPPLRSEAYTAEKLNAQLDEQGRLFLGARDRNYFDAKSGTLHLSPIFKWFSGDFESKSGSVTKFVTPYFPAEVQQQIKAAPSVRVRYTDYDWSLNAQSKP